MDSSFRTGSYITQIGFLLLCFGLGIVLSSAILLPLASGMLHAPMQAIPALLSKSENAGISRMVQGLGSVLTLGLPAVVFARLVHLKPVRYLGFSRYGTGKQVFLVILIIFAGFMVGGALSRLNEAIPLPHDLEAKFKALETQYAQQIIAIAGMKNISEYLVALFVLAFLPALTEELFFRSCLQQVLVGWTNRVFTGILLTSILFSLAHSSFYGFLPRLFLGIVLGYLFYNSKNIWLSIWAHFFNNAFSLTQLYVLSRKGKLTTESMNDSFPLYIGLLGLVAVIAVFYSFQKESNRILAIRETNEQHNIDQ